MPRREKMRRTGCPVAFALDTFGDRWSLLIIRDIILRGSKTYGEFLEAGEGIATNILADRLRELEDAGILEKSRDPNDRKRYIYRLTEKGIDLVPVIFDMIQWSAKYDPQTTARKEVVKKIKIDRQSFIKEIQDRLRES